MSLIMNGTGISISEIPSDGVINYDGTSLDKVIWNGTEVWKRQTEFEIPPTANITDYVQISGGSALTDSMCDRHNEKCYPCYIWYATENTNPKTEEKTYIFKPKPPYTKIRATVHLAPIGAPWPAEECWANVNGIPLFGRDSAGNAQFADDVVVESEQIEIHMGVGCETWEWNEDGGGHWQTSLYACISNIVLLT